MTIPEAAKCWLHVDALLHFHTSDQQYRHTSKRFYLVRVLSIAKSGKVKLAPVPPEGQPEGHSGASEWLAYQDGWKGWWVVSDEQGTLRPVRRCDHGAPSVVRPGFLALQRRRTAFHRTLSDHLSYGQARRGLSEEAMRTIADALGMDLERMIEKGSR